MSRIFQPRVTPPVIPKMSPGIPLSLGPGLAHISPSHRTHLLTMSASPTQSPLESPFPPFVLAAPFAMLYKIWSKTPNQKPSNYPSSKTDSRNPPTCATGWSEPFRSSLHIPIIPHSSTPLAISCPLLRLRKISSLCTRFTASFPSP